MVAQADEERTTTRNQCFIDAPPAAVFAVLADPDSHNQWVVGVRNVETLRRLDAVVACS